MGSAVPAAMAMSMGWFMAAGFKRYQCRHCGHQATLTAGTIMQATKLPLTTWFLAFYLIGQAKTGISSLELSRHLGVKVDTAWLLHNKILRAMADREEAYLLRGKIQRSMTPTSAENCRAARQAGDRRTRSPSSRRSP